MSFQVAIEIPCHSALVTAKIPRTKDQVPWSKLAKHSKEERTKMRASVGCDEATDSSKAARASLILGINAVTRALEKGETSVVLLANDIDPPMLAHHVSDLCVVKRVPLIIMESLKETTEASLGFSCIALGIKHDQTHFTELQEQIVELSSFFPIPDGPMFQKVHQDIDECSIPDEPSKIIQEEWDPNRLEHIYLHRKSRKERVFIPLSSSSICLPAGETLNFDKDFISFGTSGTQKSQEPSTTHAQSETEMYCFTTPLGIDETLDDSPIESLPKKQKISHYKPLVVKTIQSNPNKKRKNKKKKNKSGKM